MNDNILFRNIVIRRPAIKSIPTATTSSTTTAMSSRGLPGFLRRSRRWDDEDEDVGGADDDGDFDYDGGDDDGDDANDDTEDTDDNDNNKYQLQPSKVPSRQFLDPSPLAESSAHEDLEVGYWAGKKFTSDEQDEAAAAAAAAIAAKISINDGREQHDDSAVKNNENDIIDNNNHSNSNHSVSTLGDFDPTVEGVVGVVTDTPRNASAMPSRSSPTMFSSNNTNPKFTRTASTYREVQFEKILSNPVVKMTELRKIGWNGIPPQYRGMTWKILLGYLPTNASRRQQILERKRAEYKEAIKQHYNIDDNSRTLQEQETLRQVLVDVPRTAPEIPLFRNEKIKRALTRLLYIWSMRHPASSYVQGINDLATPLFAVFLADDYQGEDVLDGSVMVVLTEERLDEVEADVYWCLTNILAGIQDHYTADQPGVQRMVMRLQELVNRIDGDLCDHIQSVGIQFMQFAFKWMNCLLLREFNLKCVIRLWDTYISEDGNGFEDFHVYVCAAFLCQFSSQLQTMDFDELFQFMQQVPTEDWGETEIEMLLSQAYVLSTLFGGSDAHLTSNSRAPPPVM